MPTETSASPAVLYGVFFGYGSSDGYAEFCLEQLCTTIERATAYAASVLHERQAREVRVGKRTDVPDLDYGSPTFMLVETLVVDEPIRAPRDV